MFYCAFSCLGHGLYVGCSNLANSIYALVLLHSIQMNVDQRQSSSSITVSSTVAKKAIKIDCDLLLSDTVQQAAMRLSCQTMADS